MKKKIFYILIFFSLFFIYGNIYFWTDENGIRHFSNISPPLDQKAEEINEINEVNDVFSKLKSKKNKKQGFKVVKVFDGDTIKAAGFDLLFKIRLAGIDSPETGFKNKKGQPFAQKAKSYLSRLLNNKEVIVKSHGIGGYNRLLAEVFIGDININLEMVKAGLAEVYRGSRPKTLNAKIIENTV